MKYTEYKTDCFNHFMCSVAFDSFMLLCTLRYSLTNELLSCVSLLPVSLAPDDVISWLPNFLSITMPWEKPLMALQGLRIQPTSDFLALLRRAFDHLLSKPMASRSGGEL